jgi:glucokinase
VYLTVGSGIGGALIVEGRIYRGFGQGAMELGHIRVLDVWASGDRLVELEQVASGWAIATTARKHAQTLIDQGPSDWLLLQRSSGDPQQITAQLVAQAALEGDPVSSAILDRARAALSFALTQAIALLAPRRIVMGGGVSLIGNQGWFDPIRRLVQQHVFSPFRHGFDIVPAALGEEVVVHGALALAREGLSTPRGRD